MNKRKQYGTAWFQFRYEPLPKESAMLADKIFRLMEHEADEILKCIDGEEWESRNE